MRGGRERGDKGDIMGKMGEREEGEDRGEEGGGGLVEAREEAP